MRNTRVDLLRCIGLLMIVIAHLGPPEWLFQLRNFDVPLMVLVSGISFGIAYRPAVAYRKYLSKRFVRLVLPVWAFLGLFFAGLIVFKPDHPLLRMNTVIESFLLLEGIGYVWIIRIFLFVAVMAPGIHTLHRRVASNRNFLLTLLGVGIAYSFSIYEMERALTGGLPLVASTLLEAVPYGIVFALGLRLPQLSVGGQRALTGFFTVGFVVLAIILYLQQGGFVQTQAYKYPATLYYLSYALAVATGLWYCSEGLWGRLGYSTQQFVNFVSFNSIWIYLWHIPLLMAVGLMNAPFVVALLLTLSGSLLITYLQGIVMQLLFPPHLVFNRTLRTVFGVVLPAEESAGWRARRGGRRRNTARRTLPG